MNIMNIMEIIEIITKEQKNDRHSDLQWNFSEMTEQINFFDIF